MDNEIQEKIKKDWENKITNLFKEYTEKEEQLIVSAFKDNEQLAKAIRKHLLQMPLNAVDQSLLIIFNNNPDLGKIIRKVVLPVLEPDGKLKQIMDLMMTIKLEETIHGTYLNILARIKLINYLDQQLKRLEKQEVAEKIKLDKLISIKGKTEDKMYIDLIARNTAVKHIDESLFNLYFLANMPKETPQQIQERMEKDSSK